MKPISLIFGLLFYAVTLFGQEREPLVMISTDYGDIIVKLYNDTPLHRDNFLKLVKEGHYNKSSFHRIIKDFMIQGGESVPHTITAEITKKHHHKKGALAAARRPDKFNPEKRSSGSQFYIVEGKVYDPKMLMQMQRQTGKVYTQKMVDDYTTIGGAPHLDRDYTVFGEVVMGLEIVDRISKVKTDSRDKPLETVEMTIKVLD